MLQNKDKIWQDVKAMQLAKVLVDVDNVDEMKNFLRDVMTEKEIIEISSRLEAARMLQMGEKYIEIAKVTKLSSRTIARISDWMKNGNGGYSIILDKLNNHHDHISPVRAE